MMGNTVEYKAEQLVDHLTQFKDLTIAFIGFSFVTLEKWIDHVKVHVSF